MINIYFDGTEESLHYNIMLFLVKNDCYDVNIKNILLEITENFKKYKSFKYIFIKDIRIVNNLVEGDSTYIHPYGKNLFQSFIILTPILIFFVFIFIAFIISIILYFYGYEINLWY